MLKKLLRERVEFVGRQAQDGGAGFVGECAGGVPGLDLLAEDYLQFAGVFLGEEGKDGGGEGEEHFCGEL